MKASTLKSLGWPHKPKRASNPLTAKADLTKKDGAGLSAQEWAAAEGCEDAFLRTLLQCCADFFELLHESCSLVVGPSLP